MFRVDKIIMMPPAPTNYDKEIDLIYEGIISLINEKIEERGWKRTTDFANAVGMSSGWPSQIMSKKPEVKTDLSLKALIKIALVLGVHPASLIPYNPENKASPPKDLDEYIENIVDERMNERMRLMIQEELSKYNKKEG